MDAEDTFFGGLLVCEIADRRNQYAGKLLADSGATVVQIEPLTPGPARQAGPFAGDTAHPDRCLDYWYYNTGKRSVALDLTTARGRAIATRLAEASDVLLHSFTGREAAGVGFDRLIGSGRTVVAAITDFGQSGPWRDYLANDAAHLALGGQMASSGYSDPAAAPVGGQGHQSWHIAGVLCVQAITVALIERMASGMGQNIDCAIHDCAAVCTEMAIPWWVYGGTILYRQTGQHAHPQRMPEWMLPCADGRYLNTIATELSDLHWVHLVAWMEEYGVAGELSDPRYLDGAYRMERFMTGPEIRDGFRRLLARVPSEEAMRRAQSCRLAWGVVRPPEENLSEQHWIERGFFSRIESEDLGMQVCYPSRPFACASAPVKPMGRAPSHGEHTTAILQEVLGVTPSELDALRAGGIIR